jgi:hypothetical protein
MVVPKARSVATARVDAVWRMFDSFLRVHESSAICGTTPLERSNLKAI